MEPIKKFIQVSSIHRLPPVSKFYNTSLGLLLFQDGMWLTSQKKNARQLFPKYWFEEETPLPDFGEPDYSNTINMHEIEPNARKLAVLWGENMKDHFILQKAKLASDVINYAKWYAANQLKLDDNGWISVHKGMPDYNQEVICYNHNGSKPRVMTGYLFKLEQGEREGFVDEDVWGDKECNLCNGGDFWAFPYICHTNFITHWQPKPPPPIKAE